MNIKECYGAKYEDTEKINVSHKVYDTGTADCKPNRTETKIGISL